MGTEIERKFLVKDDSWRAGAPATRIRQGYLAYGPPVAARIRIRGDKATLNVKKATLDIVRTEFEYAIPPADAEHMLAEFCRGRVVEKTRYLVSYGGFEWEVDVFEGENAGLVVAEIELDAPDREFPRPDWLGEEVSGDPRYLNTSLSAKPFRLW